MGRRNWTHTTIWQAIKSSRFHYDPRFDEAFDRSEARSQVSSRRFSEEIQRQVALAEQGLPHQIETLTKIITVRRRCPDNTGLLDAVDLYLHVDEL